MVDNRSNAEITADLPKADRDAIFAGFTEQQWADLEYDAEFWLRPKQKIQEGEWFITALVAGRGFGKTRTAAEWVRKKAMDYPGCRIAVAGRTVGDIREVMVMGDSGILAVHPDHERPEYKAHERKLVWPNGSQALLLSSEIPDGARGPQFHFAVGDEFAAWKTTVDGSGATLYSNLLMATRLTMGDSIPQILFATTPKRTKTMKDIMEKSLDPREKIVIIGGSTRENRGLAGSYIENIEREFGNSALAKQELLGEMLEDVDGLVFTDAMLETSRHYSNLPAGLLKIIAVDPTVSGDPKRADECGIMVMGATPHYDPFRRKAYVIEDASLRATPEVWAQRVVDMAQKHGITNIVCEANQGGQLLQMVINTKDPSLKVSLVHAKQGKVKRTEPVVVAMQQERVKFVGDFPELEQQLIYYDPDNSTYSPDRMDAFVWGCIALLVAPPKGLVFARARTHRATGRRIPNGIGTGRARQINSFARGPK